VVLLAVCGLGSVIGAQEPTATHTEEGLPPPPETLASARATMKTFLEAFYAEEGADLEQAARCLDLSEVPSEVLGLKGRELSVQLKDVIDRTRYVEYEKIPDDPDGTPYVFLRTPEGEVVIARQADGSWMFTAATLSSLGALHRATAGREVVAGVERTAPTTVTPATWLRSLVPSSLRAQTLFLETWQWIGLLLVVILGVVIDRILVFMARVAIDRLLRSRELAVEGSLLTNALRPAGALVMVLMWYLGILWLGLPVGILRVYLSAVKVVAVFAAVVTAYQLVNVVTDILGKRAARTESKFDDLVVPLTRKSLKIFVVAVGMVFVAQNLDVDVAGLVAGLGLGGLAFALAAKDTVSNLFGSFTVLLDRPFHVGDWVVIGDIEGTVAELGFRSTRIRTFYNSLITLPNSTLINVAVDNLGAREYRRWSTRIGVTYDTPPEKLDAFCEGIRELVRGHPYTRKDYFHVYFNEFGESGLQILLYVFFQTPDWATELRERHRLGVDIARLAAELGVEFAFPSRTVYLRREEWSPAAAAGEGYPKETERLSTAARGQARKLVDGVLHGEVPAPVSFERRSGDDDEKVEP
jgi:MscS family membrane protein